MISIIHCFEQHCSFLWTAVFIIIHYDSDAWCCDFQFRGQAFIKDVKKIQKEYHSLYRVIGTWSFVSWKVFWYFMFYCWHSSFTRFIYIADIQPIIQVGAVQGWECLGSPGSSCERYRNFASQWISFIWHHPLRLEYDFIYPIICTYCMYIHSEPVYLCTLLDTTVTHI